MVESNCLWKLFNATGGISQDERLLGFVRRASLNQRLDCLYAVRIINVRYKQFCGYAQILEKAECRYVNECTGVRVGLLEEDVHRAIL